MASETETDLVKIEFGIFVVSQVESLRSAMAVVLGGLDYAPEVGADSQFAAQLTVGE